VLSKIIPNIFFKIWFWLPVVAIVIAIQYIWGKTPPPPKPGPFFSKHKRTIGKITDAFIICLVLGLCFVCMRFPISRIFEAVDAPAAIHPMIADSAWAGLLATMTMCSGLSGFLLGLLSVFQTKLTAVKRIVLFCISASPMLLSVWWALVEPSYLWSAIKIGAMWSLCCCIINGPAVVVGKHIFEVSWIILCKLRVASGDFPG
jgi:hypothetical protein